MTGTLGRVSPLTDFVCFLVMLALTLGRANPGRAAENAAPADTPQAPASRPRAGASAPPFPFRVVMLQNVAGGLVRALHGVLTDRCAYPRANAIVLAEEKGLKDLADGPATKTKFFDVLDDLAERLGPEEQLIVVFACHMKKGFLINDQISYKELDDHLTRFRRGTRVAVIIEGCYSGAAIGELKHADVVYAAGTADQPTWGGFLKFWVDAVGASADAVKTADADHDARVSLGEAYDYASDSDRLTTFYRGLPKTVWPTTMVPAPVRRARVERMDYQMWLVPVPDVNENASPGSQ